MLEKQHPKLEICFKRIFSLEFIAKKFSFEISAFNTRHLVFSDKKIWKLGENKITAIFVTSVRTTSGPRPIIWTEIVTRSAKKNQFVIVPEELNKNSNSRCWKKNIFAPCFCHDSSDGRLSGDKNLSPLKKTSINCDVICSQYLICFQHWFFKFLSGRY